MADGEGRNGQLHVFFTAGLADAFALRRTARSMTDRAENGSTTWTQIPGIRMKLLWFGRLNRGELVCSDWLSDFDRDGLWSLRIVVRPGNVYVARNHIDLGLSRDARAEGLCVGMGSDDRVSHPRPADDVRRNEVGRG